MSKVPMCEFVSNQTAVCLTDNATGREMYGTYLRHDANTITVYGMICGGITGDKMKAQTFYLADVEVNFVGKLKSV